MAGALSRTRLVSAALTGIGFGAAACTRLIGADDRYYAADDSLLSEGGVMPSDAAPDVVLREAADDGNVDAETSPDAGPHNEVQNASFENGIFEGNCGSGWTASPSVDYFGTATAANTGVASCKYCNRENAGDAFIASVLPVAPAGVNIVTSAFFKLDSDSGAGTFGLALAACKGGACFSYQRGTATALGWTRVLGPQIPVPPDGGGVPVSLEIRVANGCVLVDDVEVVYVAMP